MQLLTRTVVALAVTVLAALVLYFVFLHGQHPARGAAQSADHHIGDSLTTDAGTIRHLMRVDE